jgi:hypothetical protein
MSDHVVGLVSLTSGLPGLIEVCLHLGGFLVTKIGVYNAADEVIKDYQLRLDLHWQVQKLSLQELKKYEAALAPDVKGTLHQILEKLKRLLENAVSHLVRCLPAANTSVNDEKILSRVRFAISSEKVLATLIAEISSWEDLYMKGLVLVARLNPLSPVLWRTDSRSGDKRIPLLTPNESGESKSFELPHDEHAEADLLAIEQDNMNTARLFIFQSKPNPEIILEQYENQVSLNAAEEMRALAERLCNARPELMHILPCRGFSSLQYLGERTPFMHFEIPLSLRARRPRLLWSLLAETGPKHSLNDRFRLAKELATSVWYVHSGNFVHKRVRPDSILVFDNDKSTKKERYPYKLGPLFLAGFSRFRQVSSGTTSWDEGLPESLAYQHPDRWFQDSRKPFTFLDDIYGLAVVLLQIGLWNTLLTPTGMSCEFPSALQVKTGTPGAGAKVKDWLLGLADRNLERTMGNEYRDIVIACLTCKEGGLSSLLSLSADPETDASRAYLEGVIQKLDSIHL